VRFLPRRANFVLFVDDDAAFAAAAASDLKSAGMRTVVALDSMVALTAFESNAFDVVITDIKLLEGGPCGLALARTIRNKKPHLPTIPNRGNVCRVDVAIGDHAVHLGVVFAEDARRTQSGARKGTKRVTGPRTG
jgi:CheY-like chemotaxis protein